MILLLPQPLKSWGHRLVPPPLTSALKLNGGDFNSSIVDDGRRSLQGPQHKGYSELLNLRGHPSYLAEKGAIWYPKK